MRRKRSSETVTPLTAAAQSPLGDHLVFFLAQLEHHFRAHLIEALSSFALDLRQYSTLALLAGGRPTTQHQLGQVLRLDPSQVVTLTKSLAGRGFITRQPFAEDRRTLALSLTTAGEQLYEQAASEVQRIEAELTAPLSTRDHSALKSLLTRIVPVS